LLSRHCSGFLSIAWASVASSLLLALPTILSLSVARFDWIYCSGFLAFARTLSRFWSGSFALSLRLSRAFPPALSRFRSGSLAAAWALSLPAAAARALSLPDRCRSGSLVLSLSTISLLLWLAHSRFGSLLCSGSTRSMAVGQCSSFLFPLSSLSMRCMVRGPSLSLREIFA
jgi:hypothetical protein